MDGHIVAATIIPEVVFLALSQLRWSFVPRYNGIIEGHLALEGGRLMLAHHNVLDALCKLNGLGCVSTKRVTVRLYRKKFLSLCPSRRYLKSPSFYPIGK